MGFNKKFFQTGGIVASSAGALIATDNFSPVIYSGNGTTQSISSLDFQPDLVFIKQRSGTQVPIWYDSVRGVHKYIYSSSTAAEGTSSTTLTSFDSNGFSVGNSNSENQSGQTYVAWCWKAGGAAVSNTDGTITSTVSANQDAGFSIVSYTANGTAGTTIGHGLSSAPELIIVKHRNGASNWAVYATGLSAVSKYLYLNTSGGEASSSNPDEFHSTAPTSSVFSIGLSGNTNTSSGNYIAYCFHSVDGYQRVSSYTGSGSSGKRVYTTDDGTSTGNGGFRPRWVMVKATTGLAYQRWYIEDSTRGGGQVLYANENFSEASYTSMSFNDDGFTLNTTDGGVNASGTTFIYLAIA